MLRAGRVQITSTIKMQAFDLQNERVLSEIAVASILLKCTWKQRPVLNLTKIQDEIICFN